MSDKDLRKSAKKAKPTKTATVTKRKLQTTSNVDINSVELSQTDLAYCLGITTANITGFIQNGLLKKNANGKMDLVECVSTYCKSLRERKAGTGKTDLELENLALKNEKIKEALRSWRMQRDREVAMAILDAQRNAMLKLREECKLVPALVEVIDGMLSNIDKTDVADICYTVEGETEDEE